MITDTSDTPTASRSGRPKPSVSSGTMSTPPPRPRSEPNTPAAAPPPTIRRPTTTSDARRPRDGRSALLRQRRSGAEMLRCVREQGDVSGALQRDCQLALVPGTGPGLSSRLDLGALRQVAAEAVDLLVIDLDGLVGAEGADLSATSVAVEVVALAGLGGRHRIRS